MRILYILDKPNLYGSEQHLLSLIGLMKKDHDLTVLAFSDGPLLALIHEQGIAVNMLPIKWYSFLKLATFTKFLNDGAFDLIHAHQPKALLWGSIASRLCKIPCIITVHSLPSSNMQSYNNLVFKVAVGAFHYIVKGISEWSASKVIYLSRFSYQSALFKKKAVIIPNWVNVGVEQIKLKRTFNAEPEFISVGSVTYNKGMDRMISALALIKNHRWSLKIVGSYQQDYQARLEQQAAALGIGDRITYLGYLTNPEELLLKSDGFILLSRGETFGLVYIEAMKFGLPIIAWDIPVVKEIIPEGNLILNNLSDITQVFNTFYSSQSNYSNLALKNHNFVMANFTGAGIMPKYTNLYAEVLSDSRN